VISGKRTLRVQNYYIAWTLVTIGLFLAIKPGGLPRRPRPARHQRNEEAAAAMGVNVSRYKLAVFVTSAVYASVGGAFLAH